MLADSTVTLSGSGTSHSSHPSAAAIAAASAAIAALSPRSQASSSSLSISPVPTSHPQLPQLHQFLLSPESVSSLGITGSGAVNTTNGPHSQAATAAAALMMNPAAYLAAPFLYGNNALRYRHLTRY